ncbi:unnamed protein product [Prorocentrum cordatum]|uniref:Uncharacterized protein n=1 Tax=Prorocentrum cordatum TaxID=2364126 RepID=A0ABN9YLD6_9DINO|nr:unnamed protein product [Polarella glacialis]
MDLRLFLPKPKEEEEDEEEEEEEEGGEEEENTRGCSGDKEKRRRRTTNDLSLRARHECGWVPVSILQTVAREERLCTILPCSGGAPMHYITDLRAAPETSALNFRQDSRGSRGTQRGTSARLPPAISHAAVGTSESGRTGLDLKLR